MTLTTILMTVLGLLVGAALGIGLYAKWRQLRTAASLRLPHKWPLVARTLMTNEEYEVLRWLQSIFHDHLVMVKLPVLRFTRLAGRPKVGAAPPWQELLNGVYCTFTVCTASGTVVGCVDVPGKRGLNKPNRDLKDSLLSDCHIAYTVVRSLKLPKGSAMRAAFLGELQDEDQVEHQETRGGDSSFQADLNGFNREKKLAAKEAALKELNHNDTGKIIISGLPAGLNADGNDGPRTAKPDRFPTQWEDSYIQPDESRPAKLS